MTTNTDVERLIARLLDWDEWDEGKINDARYDAVAALRAMQAERDGAWKVAHDATTRGMKAEAKLADVERERDDWHKIAMRHLAGKQTAEATVASLKEQVDAMRGAIGILEDALQEAGDDYPGSRMQEWCQQQVSLARAALTTENQTNG